MVMKLRYFLFMLCLVVAISGVAGSSYVPSTPIMGVDEDGKIFCSNDHFTIPPLSQTDNAYKIYVIGDSIAWGNGLDTTDKYYYQVAEDLQKSLSPGTPVEVIVYAHSGAVITGDEGKPLELQKNANLNSGWPTIMDQAKNIKDDADLVLISGGINDVGISNIMDPNTPAKDVESLSADIKKPMTDLLTYLMDKTAKTDAKIIVTGYYPIITDESKLTLQDRVIGSALATTSEKTTSQASDVLDSSVHNPIGAGTEALIYLAEGAFNNAANFLSKDSKLRENSNTFYVTSTKSLETAVEDVDKDGKRVAFVDPSFQSKNSYRSSESFLWKATSITKTNDDQYYERSKLTNAVDIPNKINAVAHPNVEGASRYADFIVKKIEGSDWLPSASSEEATPAAVDALLMGIPQSPITWLDPDPTDTSKSNTQGTAQTTSQSTNAKFSIGAKVKVTDSLNVRDAPGLSSRVKSTKATGSTATVLSGPYYADGFTWWKVRYDDGTEGWSQDKRLTAYVPAPNDDLKTKLAQQGLGTPLLQPPASSASADAYDYGSSGIGKPLIGGNNPEKSPTEAEFPWPYDPDLPCI